MATVVVMPALGNSVESCLVTTWMVKEGDEVKENDTLAEVETDKAAMEVPSSAAGTVLKLLWEEGDEVPVKEPFVILGEPGEDLSGLVDADASHDEGAEAAADGVDVKDGEAGDEPVAETKQVARTESHGASSPRARALADAKHVDIASITEGSGPNGRVIERDVEAAIASGAATAAGARAGAVGSGAAGTGLGGRITAADVAKGAAQPQAAAAAPQLEVAEDEVVETPLKGIRKVISDRMMESLQTSAQLSYTVTANAAGLMAMRKKFKHSDPELGYSKITIGDLVGYAAVKTIARHTTHNAHLVDGVLTEYKTVHMGFACDTPRGLLVPVVRDASKLSLKDFSDQSKELARAAIDGNISPDLLNGATFTVTNLGGFGVETFTPILNAPQTAILGVAAITPRVKILDDGTVGAEQRIGFSLTADHRVIDGADAARFLQDLVRAIENIELTILG